MGEARDPKSFGLSCPRFRDLHMMSLLLCRRFGEKADRNVTSGPTWPRAATLQVCARACGRQLIRLAVVVVLWVGPAVACCYPWYEPLAVPMNSPVPPPGEPSSTPVAALSPQQALITYEARALRQLTTLAAYSDQTTIEAEIPAIGEKGQCSLRRTFSAPQSLIYTAVEFVGDTFVRTNVIYRVLESDVENVEKKTGQRVAMLEINYRFSYKGIEDLNGRPLYAFALKPHRKDPGLFKGKILIDPQTGHIVRAVGRLSKSPSWWIKRIDFIQDYVDVGDFTMSAQIQSVTQARIAGRIVVNIRHAAYEVPQIEQRKSAPNSIRSCTASGRGPT
jgi:hypothetical protein